jgi:hypothetical protein
LVWVARNPGQADAAALQMMMQPNGTRFGGWSLNTADNEF